MAQPYFCSGILRGMSSVRARYSNILQNLSCESVTADHLCIYLFLLAWSIWGVNDPTIY
jgi:hypothetical protein